MYKKFKNSINRWNTRFIKSTVDNKTQDYFDVIDNTSFLQGAQCFRARLDALEQGWTDHKSCWCGKPVYFKGFWRDTCSIKCTHKSPERISRMVSGRDIEKSNQKRKETMVNKYGVEFSSQRESFKENARNRVYSEETILRMRKNALENQFGYIDRELLQPDNVRELNKKYTVPVIAKMCRCSPSYVHRLMSIWGIQPNGFANSSLPEKILSDHIKNLGFDIICGSRRLLGDRREIDIFVPSKNLGIEVNGLRFHSEVQGGKTRTYHIDKTESAIQNGIELLHFTDYEILNQEDIVKSMISTKLGVSKRIFARKCTLKEIDRKSANQFFSETHIQGGIHNSNLNLAIMYDNEIVACSAFGRTRFTNEANLELLRFSSRLNTVVVGGLSKILSYIKEPVISYADRRYSLGKSYSACGFKHLRNSKPGYTYIVNGNLESRMKYQKHKLPKLLNTFDSSLTEWENMKCNGYDRIWDCGNMVFLRDR